VLGDGQNLARHDAHVEQPALAGDEGGLLGQRGSGTGRLGTRLALHLAHDIEGDLALQGDGAIERGEPVGEHGDPLAQAIEADARALGPVLEADQGRPAPPAACRVRRRSAPSRGPPGR
jgi:hypothetical protein